MTYASEVLADSPLIYWRLGESSGTVAADASGHGNAGTYTNGPTLGTAGLVAGDSDTAVTFDGVDDSVRSTLTFGSMLSAFTAEAIIKPSVISNGPFVIGLADDTIDLSINIDGSLFGIAGAGSFQSAAGLIVTGTTYHLALVWDGISTATIYRNGVSVATGTGNTATPGGVGFWAGDDAVSDPFSGVIDEVAYYTTALSTARILAHYNAMASTGNYRFNPPTEQVVSNVAEDAPHPLSNRLGRYYPIGPRGRQIWKLMDGTFTFTQPYPTIEDTYANRMEQSAAQVGGRWTNYAITYKYTYLGGHTYTVDATEEALLATFLTAAGYTASDWLVPQ